MSEEKGRIAEGLTIAELRKFKNYENVSDEQAQEILFAIKNLAVILYEYLNEKKINQELKVEYNEAA
jgi:predicted AAA+ superfamily ATPase